MISRGEIHMLIMIPMVVLIFMITNSTSDVVTLNRYRQYRLRGSHGYENSTFYFLYVDPMKC